MVVSSIPGYTWQSEIFTWPMDKQLGLKWSSDTL